MEALVTCVILGMLFLMLMAMYVSCLGVWERSSAQSDLLNGEKVTLGRLSRDVAESTYGGLSLAPGAVSLICCTRDDGSIAYDKATSEVLWDNYHLYYLQSSDATVQMLRRDVTGPARFTAEPLEPVLSYCVPGQRLCANVKNFQVRRLRGNLLEIDLETERKRYGSEAPERVRRVICARMHN